MRAPEPRAFLFCCPLRSGAVAIALAHTAAALLLMFADAKYLIDFDHRFNAARRAGILDGSVAEYNVEKLLLGSDVLLQLVGLLFALLLLLGALEGQQWTAGAWAAFALAALALYASRTAALLACNWPSRLSHSLSTLALVAVVTLYSAAAMLKLQRELREAAAADAAVPPPAEAA